MSKRNLEIVRRLAEASQRWLEAYRENPRSGVAALEAGDLDPDTEEVLGYLHPEVEIRPRALALSGGALRGHYGWLAFWDGLLEASEDYALTVTGLEDVGGGEVLALTMGSIKWKGSGMKMEQTTCYLFTLREGLIVRVDGYLNREEALEAAGLSE